MELFLIHSLCLLWLSVGTARYLVIQTQDRIMAAGVLAWGNIVLTALLLSIGQKLGETWWFLGSSLTLAVTTCILSMKMSPQSAGSRNETVEPSPDKWILIAFCATILPLAIANFAVAYTYQPNTPDALTWQLPRAMYYLGQGSLNHFDTADLRQTFLPFNYNLLELFGLIYAPPLTCLNFFNLAAWAFCGIGVYRLCCLTGSSAKASLVTSWLTLTALPVVAQAVITTADLPIGAGLVAALVFGLQYHRTHKVRFANLTALTIGLVAGSDLRAMLLCAIAGLSLLGWSFIRQRSKTIPPVANRFLRWGTPILLVCGLSLPFALINLVETGQFLEGNPREVFTAASTDLGHFAWSAFLPILSKSAPLVPLNENLVSFGFTGLLFIVTGIYGTLRLQRYSLWLVLIALGWIMADLLLSRCSQPTPRNLVPALFLLSPCASLVIGSVSAGRPIQRWIGGLTVFVVLLAGGWSAGVYLLRNTSRPLLPLLNSAFIPPGASSLPLLLEHHLSRQSRINILSDGVDERIFPFMIQRNSQRITSFRQINPETYNLISRSTDSRNSAYMDLSCRPSYTIISLPSKPTAGVEFLGTIVNESGSRDYFGVVPRASQTTPVATNRTLLVTLYHNEDLSGQATRVRLSVAGLNSEDHARLIVEQKESNGSILRLAVFDAQGETTALVHTPFDQLNFRVLDDNETEMGSTAITYRPSALKGKTNLDPRLPTSTNSIFVTDLVQTKDTGAISVTGLLPVEGPFPQWDLPYLRWQRQPSASVTIPPTDQLTHLQLSFSVRLNVRRKAALEVMFNGHVVRQLRLDDHLAWYDVTLDLTPLPGENVLEFRDAPLNNEPNWLDYLERYPDVKVFVRSQGQPLEKGAKEHYETHGQAEGRTLNTILKPEPAPDGYYFMYRNIRLEGFKHP